MTAYDVRRKMSEAWKLKREVVAKQEAMEELRSIAEKATTSFSPAPGGSQGSSSSRVENYAIRIVEMQEDLMQASEHLLDALREVMALIELADEPIQRAALTQYHLNGKTAEESAKSIAYSTSQFWRVVNEGYVAIAERWNKMEWNETR